MHLPKQFQQNLQISLAVQIPEAIWLVLALYLCLDPLPELLRSLCLAPRIAHQCTMAGACLLGPQGVLGGCQVGHCNQEQSQGAYRGKLELG